VSVGDDLPALDDDRSINNQVGEKTMEKKRLILQSCNHLYRGHRLLDGVNSNGLPTTIAIFMSREPKGPCTTLYWYCSQTTADTAMDLIEAEPEKNAQILKMIVGKTSSLTGKHTGITSMCFESETNYPGQRLVQPVFSDESEFSILFVPEHQRYATDFYREDTGPRPARKPEAVVEASTPRTILRKREERQVEVQGVERDVAEEYQAPSWDFKSDHFDPKEAQTWRDLFTDDALDDIR
tara:strand:+ start:1308 stop:2024 length:717 start_codon:yes stop_codon:yes gene_type:complete